MEPINFEEAEIYEPEAGWERRALASDDQMSVEWYTKPPGHESPMHDHENAQIAIVLEGELTTYTDEEELVLQKYDSVWLDPWEAHRMKNTGDEMAVGLDIFAPGRSFDYWLEKKE